MNVMKPSLTIFPCVLGSALHHIRVCRGLSFATKRIGPPCCTLFTFITCYSLQIILSQNYLLPIVSSLAENTLLKTAYHFLLLLVGFDTLTYQKDYDRFPTLVGHHVPRPCLYMLGSLSLTWVFRMCKPVLHLLYLNVVYHTRSSRSVSTRRTIATVHTQGEHLYLEI